MRLRRDLTRLSALCAAALLAACGGEPRVDGPTCRGFEPGADMATMGIRGETAADALVADIAESLSRAVATDRRGDADGPSILGDGRGGARKLDVLAITTGGQNGAFAAGVLAGWDKPDFTVVTGASAGGLIAPVAFAGPEFDGDLSKFSNIDQDQIIRRKPLYGLFSNSVYATTLLAQRTREAYSTDLIEAIEQRSTGGAYLFIGATDIDSTRFQRFDVPEMLEQEGNDDQRRTCLTAAAMASSAIPVVFPPQPVNGRLYVDAGVRQHVFLAGLGDAVTLTERRENTNFDVTVTLLINSDLTYDDKPVNNAILPLAERNIGVVSDEGMRASIRQALQFAKDKHWTVQAMAIPPDFDPGSECDWSGQLFSACYTKALFETGRAMGASGTAWLDATALANRVASGG